MLSIQRILWPTDFSTGAGQAFPHAAALASWHEAELHVLNVKEKGTEVDESFPVPQDALGDLLTAEGDPPQHVDLDALTLVQEQQEYASPPPSQL